MSLPIDLHKDLMRIARHIFVVLMGNGMQLRIRRVYFHVSACQCVYVCVCVLLFFTEVFVLCMCAW